MTLNFSGPASTHFSKNQQHQISLNAGINRAIQCHGSSFKFWGLSWTVNSISFYILIQCKNSQGFLNLCTLGLKNFISTQRKSAYWCFSPIWYIFYNLAKTNTSGAFLSRSHECKVGPKLGNHHFQRVFIGGTFSWRTIFLFDMPTLTLH